MIANVEVLVRVGVCALIGLGCGLTGAIVIRLIIGWLNRRGLQ